AAQAGDLVHQRRHVLALQLLLALLEPARQLVALALQLCAVFAQLLHQPGRLLDPLREPVEVRRHHRRGLVHLSLKRPPHEPATAATIFSWIAWTSASVSVRSGRWNSSANARLFIPSGVPGPEYTSNSSIDASSAPPACSSACSSCRWVTPAGTKNARSRRTGG